MLDAAVYGLTVIVCPTTISLVVISVPQLPSFSVHPTLILHTQPSGRISGIVTVTDISEFTFMPFKASSMNILDFSALTILPWISVDFIEYCAFLASSAFCQFASAAFLS